MGKERVASWSYDKGVLALHRAKDEAKAIVAKIDLDTVFPGLVDQPEYIQFLFTYGAKQWVSDDSSGIAGEAKLTSIKGDLTAENLKTASFSKAKGGGISYKTKMEEAQKEAEALKEQNNRILQGLLKLPIKQRQQTWNDLFDQDSRNLFTKLALEAKIDLGIK